ncbi:hypothetical protein XAP6164_4780006 [Xanthomonas phaseoli pv. phaseoli]|nr:hypothetical protein XAP6164_4780006 [Xanthomonas phaseoli pv. phaseoli]
MLHATFASQTRLHVHWLQPARAAMRPHAGEAQAKKTPAVPGLLDDWRPHGDSNPGVHRERVVS